MYQNYLSVTQCYEWSECFDIDLQVIGEVVLYRSLHSLLHQEIFYQMSRFVVSQEIWDKI